MATVIGGGKIKLNNGTTVTPQNGGWYDAQQYWNGSLGAPGVGNNPNQTDIYQKNAPTFNAADAAYVTQQQNTYQAGGGTLPGGGANGGSTGGGDAGTGAGIGYSAPDVINLPNLYKSLYDSSGISDLEKQMADRQAKYNTASSTINDNPYYSEATRTGRLAKLDTQFNNDKTALNDQIATKKADIETQLNIQTKQFDINSQAAKDALDRFNTLLDSGALSGASGEDIANITRATGLSSSAIQAAVKSTADKNRQTQVITYDDGTNQGFAVVDTKTGAVISTQTVAASKPTKSSASSGTLKKDDYISLLKQDAQKGLTLSQIYAIYSGYLDPDQILQLYNSSSKYGPDKGSISNLAKYGVTQPKSTKTTGFK